MIKIRLEEKTNHTGEITYWIYKNDSVEIPIYRTREAAMTAYHQLIEFYKNPPVPKIIEQIEI